MLIGLLLSTFAFCVFALARLNPDAQHAPPLTVTFALLLALASVIFIVVYLDRISRQQYVGNIVARVAGRAAVFLVPDVVHVAPGGGAGAAGPGAVPVARDDGAADVRRDGF